jgi:hypothetical protein
VVNELPLFPAQAKLAVSRICTCRERALMYSNVQSAIADRRDAR